MRKLQPASTSSPLPALDRWLATLAIGSAALAGCHAPVDGVEAPEDLQASGGESQPTMVPVQAAYPYGQPGVDYVTPFAQPPPSGVVYVRPVYAQPEPPPPVRVHPYPYAYPHPVRVVTPRPPPPVYTPPPINAVPAPGGVGMVQPHPVTPTPPLHGSPIRGGRARVTPCPSGGSTA